ncbi:MAG: hypothetical protein HYZ53_18620 [Planctomycetes bacterium]|nr:hypothetical protein [Planctomycetota bacterium]
MRMFAHMEDSIPFLTLLFFVACGLPADADVGPTPVRGVMLGPRTESDVRLAAEEVTLRLRRDRCEVTAEFSLENEGATKEIEVGFPDAGTVDGPRDSQTLLRDLQVKVDGKAVVPAYRPDPPSQDGQVSFRGWSVFPVRFAQGARTAISVAYWTPPQPVERLALLPTCAVLYVLRTGAAWKGTIGRARVALRLEDGLTRSHLRGLTPAGARETDDGYLWEWTDLEPAEDVQVRFVTRDAGELLAVLSRQVREVKNDAEEVELRCELDECARLCNDHEVVVAQCDWFLAREQALKAPVVPFSVQRKERKWLPWELRKARALAASGSAQAALECAATAIPRLREVLADYDAMLKTNNAGPVQAKYRTHDTMIDWAGARSGLAELEKLMEGR